MKIKAYFVPFSNASVVLFCMVKRSSGINFGDRFTGFGSGLLRVCYGIRCLI